MSQEDSIRNAVYLSISTNSKYNQEQKTSIMMMFDFMNSLSSENKNEIYNNKELNSELKNLQSINKTLELINKIKKEIE